MADKKRKALLFYLFQKRRREQIMYQNIILYAITKRNMVLHICILFVFLIISFKTQIVRVHVADWKEILDGLT
jgi:hypothetical protein